MYMGQLSNLSRFKHTYRPVLETSSYSSCPRHPGENIFEVGFLHAVGIELSSANS